jgi:tetratricopeptide (TPR) repeat protein
MGHCIVTSERVSRANRWAGGLSALARRGFGQAAGARSSPQSFRLGNKSRLILLAALSLLLAGKPAVADPHSNHATQAREQVCNVPADFFLGMEDYPSAIRLHRQVLAHDPQTALAHYHLGFAYGMVGRRQEELKEYRQAVSLGLTDWTLLLNLGLAYLEQGEPKFAADALRLAILVAPQHPESHHARPIFRVSPAWSRVVFARGHRLNGFAVACGLADIYSDHLAA